MPVRNWTSSNTATIPPLVCSQTLRRSDLELGVIGHAILHLQLSVLNTRRQRIETSWRRSGNPRAIGSEVTLVTRTGESIPRLFPRNLTTFVRTDRREHLVVLGGQH